MTANRSLRGLLMLSVLTATAGIYTWAATSPQVVVAGPGGEPQTIGESVSSVLAVPLSGPGGAISPARLTVGAAAPPQIQAVIVTATASLPISDTVPNGEISRTLYFNNSASGELTLTLQISGTPPLTLTADAAFVEPQRGFTSTLSPWTRLVTYTVATGQETQGVRFMVTDTDQLTTALQLDFIRDIAPPVSNSVVIANGAERVPTTSVTLTLSSNDSLSGVADMCISNASNCSACQPYGITRSWTLAGPENGYKTVSVWFRDYVSNTTAGPVISRCSCMLARRRALPLPGGPSLPGIVSRLLERDRRDHLYSGLHPTSASSMGPLGFRRCEQV